MDETIALLHVHPQVHADVAIINRVLPREERHRYLRRLVRAGFLDRPMFGSDRSAPGWPYGGRTPSRVDGPAAHFEGV